MSNLCCSVQLLCSFHCFPNLLEHHHLPKPCNSFLPSLYERSPYVPISMLKDIGTCHKEYTAQIHRGDSHHHQTLALEHVKTDISTVAGHGFHCGMQQTFWHLRGTSPMFGNPHVSSCPPGYQHIAIDLPSPAQCRDTVWRGKDMPATNIRN